MNTSELLQLTGRIAEGNLPSVSAVVETGTLPIFPG